MALAAQEERYVCPLSQKVLRNSVPTVLLKPTGRMVSKDSFERFVRADMVEPITGLKLKASDIIHMKSAGTGYAGGGAEVKKRKTAAAAYG